MNSEFLQMSFFGNALQSWLIALGVFFLALLILKIVKTVVISRLHIIAKKTKTDLDDIVIGAINNIHWPFYVLLSLFISLQLVNIHDKIYKVSYYALLIAVAYYAIKVAEKLIDYFAALILKNDKEGTSDSKQIIGVLTLIAKIILWAGAIMMLLANLGYDVTSLVAGLGIGGVAIALAVQNILSDMFSSFSIYFDKPFKEGDFVVVGDKSGTIKKIGIKSTRMQALQGEEIVISNQELTQAQIQNFGLMERRRVVVGLGVTYDTNSEQLKKIPGIVEKIISEEKLATFDRAHFKSFADSSLLFEIVYYIETSDYAVYMDTQANVNLKIFEQFGQENINFAFPSQTVYLKKE